MNDLVRGDVADGFGALADEFRRIAAESGESGSAFAVQVDGQTVVDLQAGWADAAHRSEWGRATIAPMFSGTKGLVAITMLRLVEAGLLDLDRPVADYWPEYAAEGKGATLVRHVVSHRAGVPGVRVPLEPADILDDVAMAERVAAEPPILAPGSAVVYHPFTFGWLCGELVRRIDGRSIARYIDDEITGPLRLRTWVGLPPELDSDVAELVFDPPAAAEALGVRAQDTLARATVFNPLLPQQWWNSPAFRAAVIPGANGISDATSMARLYGDLVASVPAFGLLTAATLELGTTEHGAGIDALMGAYSVFGVGFQLPNGTDYFGGVADAFGHGGVGGGRHGGWKSSRVGFSYLPGYVRDGARDDRAERLLRQLARLVDA